MATTTTTPSLQSQLLALFLKDEKTVLLPDVQALFTYVGQNGITLAGIVYLRKALVAVEADAVGGLQQFAKDASSLIMTYVNAATTTPPAPAPAA